MNHRPLLSQVQPQAPHLVCVGLDYQRTPIEVRESIAFAGGKLKQGLHRLQHYSGVYEAVILSTCNRVEIYALGNANIAETVLDFVHDFHGFPRHLLRPHFVMHDDRDAVRHLFCVAASLSSMVLGEAQILGQTKAALAAASESGIAGATLKRIFARAFSVAKKIRSHTSIGIGSLSVAQAAIQLAEQVHGSLDGKTFLCVGAGKMSRMALKQVAKKGPRVIVANRTLEQAQVLAEVCDGEAMPLAHLQSRLHEADIVFCSTAAVDTLLKQSDVRRALKQRRYKPMVFVDISVPRNLDPEIGALDGAYLYDVDSLSSVVQQKRSSREADLTLASQIIQAEMHHFELEQQERALAPYLSAMHRRGDEILDDRLRELVQILPIDTDPRVRAMVEKSMRSLASQLLHVASERMKATVQDASQPNV